MIQIQAKINDVGLRLDNFLIKLNIGLTKPIIYKLIRNKDIKVNNQKTIYNYRLELNDEIKIFYNVKKENLDKNLNFLNAKDLTDIIYEDSNIIIVNKPVGLLCHDDDKQTTSDTLINRIKKYLVNNKEYDYQKENQFSPSLAHRIDRNTAGLVVAAKNHVSLVSLSKIFKEHQLEKNYLALVYGIIRKTNDVIELYLKDNKNGFVDISRIEKIGYKKAITKYKLMEIIKNKYSLLDISLITGRKHQIRASLNFINYPIVGEQKYISKIIDKNNKIKHQCLVAYKLKYNIYDKKDSLFYLNNKIFETNKIWFLDLLK